MVNTFGIYSIISSIYYEEPPSLTNQNPTHMILNPKCTAPDLVANFPILCTPYINHILDIPLPSQYRRSNLENDKSYPGQMLKRLSHVKRRLVYSTLFMYHPNKVCNTWKRINI